MEREEVECCGGTELESGGVEWFKNNIWPK